MAGRSFAIPQSIDEIFNDFKGRRAGIIKALTDDVQEFRAQFVPERRGLYLFGFPDQTWKVVEPYEVFALKIPMPTIGLNSVRDEPGSTDWLSDVAESSELWLRSVAIYFGMQAGYDYNEMAMIRDLTKSLTPIRSIVEGTSDEPRDAKRQRLG